MIEDMGITRIGVIAAIYLIITLICFFLLSGPVDTILTSFEGINGGIAQNELNDMYDSIKLVMRMFWALFLSLPITWLIIKVLASRQTLYGGWNFR